MAGTLGTILGQVRLDVRQAVAAYAALRAQNQRTVYAMRGTGDSFVQAGQVMATGGAAMVYAFSRVVMAAAEFERKMDYASAVSNTTGAQMQKLSDYALQLGQDTIYSAGEIADGFIELAKAGVSAEQIIGGIGEAMANLGAAGDIPLAQSGQIITSTIQQFDLAARDATKVTDLLAGAANASIADISDIGVSLKYVGGVANAAGLSFEDTSTAISLLAKAGIRGSTAGTSLRQMIVSLGGATGPAQEALEDLGIITKDGTNKFFTAQGEAKSLSSVFQILQDSTADLTAKQRLMYLRTIFNNRALSAASILTRDGAKGFEAMNKEMSKTTAADVARERLDNLSGDIEILKGNIETLMVTAGSPFQETLRGWVQGLTRLVQAFADLDPSTQKMIIQTFAITGVMLTLMGVFSLIIGIIFRFGAAVLKMGSGLKFLWKILRIVVFNVKFLARLLIGPLVTALGAISAPVLIVVGVILALVAAFVFAYKKIAPFREFIQGLGSAIAKGLKGVANFFKTLVTDPGKAWDQIKSGASAMITALGGFFARLPGLIGRGLSAAVSAVVSFVAGVGSSFLNLSSRVISTVTGFVGRVAALFTFRNIGYALGFLVGTVVRFFITMGVRMAALALTAVTKVIGFFQRLPARIGYFIGFMVGRVVGLFIRLGIRAAQLTATLVSRVIGFFAKLPGRVVSFVTSMVTRGVSAMVNFAQRLPSLAADLVSGVINFFQELPGRVMNFITRLVSQARTAFGNMKTQAINIAQGIMTGFVDGIQGIPGAVTGILGEAIAAIKGQITSAFNAVRDFAAGMWKGFKDGLGINSPSLIEKQMYQITRVTDEETKKMRKNVLRIQGVAKNIAKTKFESPTPEIDSSAQKYARLASMQSRNQNRARTLLAASGNRQDRDRAAMTRSRGRGGRREMVITNWQTGEGYFRDVAQGTIDDNDDFDYMLGGMG